MMLSIGLMLSLTPASLAQDPVLPVAAPVVALSADEAHAETALPQEGGRWNLVLTPYFWAPTIDVNNGDLKLNFSDVWDDLNSALMLNLNATKDGSRWGFVSDTMYFDLKDNPNNIDVELKATVVGLYAKYKLDTKNVPVELLAGARYWNLSATAGPFGGSGDWIDPVIGAQSHLSLDDKWSFNVYGDVGGGGLGTTTSKFTWQAAGILNYEINRILSIAAGYRYLKVDYDADFDFDTEVYGPIAGLRITL